MAPESSLRQRKKRRSQDLLVSTALDLFEEFGFDAVTVEQIALRADLSPRTFFRYFGSKEAVLFADQEKMLGLLRDAISARPSVEPPLTALRHAVVAMGGHYEVNRESHLRRARMANTGAAIGVYQRTVVQPQWESALAEAMASRMHADIDVDPRPRLLAGIAVAVMSAVGSIWIAGGGGDIVELLDNGFQALGDAVLESLGAL